MDDDDFERLSKISWNLHPNGYAQGVINVGNRQVKVFMHRLVNETPKGMHTDHINGDKLDNRKSNLRTCVHRENQRNRGKAVRTSSKYKGVYWHGRDQKWVSRIVNKGKKIHLGYFDNEVDAALAYNEAAKQMFGEFARLNVVTTHSLSH